MGSIRRIEGPRSSFEGLFSVVTGFFVGTLLIHLIQLQGQLDLPSASHDSTISKSAGGFRGLNQGSSELSANREPSMDYYSFKSNVDLIESCLEPEGPKPVILMSLGRSGTDSTWQILKNLTGTTMKAIEIVGSNQDDTLDFFRALEGLKTEANSWAVPYDYDWRKKGGGTMSTRGFHDYIRDFCANGNCIDGKWILKWFCDEQQRYKEIGGLVGFKWKAYMSALRTEPALNALKIVASLGLSQTPIRVIRSRRNPFDVYLSELKHKNSTEKLPDHCRADDEECMQKHASIQLTVPVDDMFDWLDKTYDEENEVDALLSEMGVSAVHVEYDELYYARSEGEGLHEWNKIFKFLGYRTDREWNEIAGAAGLKPTTKSRSHKVLLENYDEVYSKLKGTKLEQFLRSE